MSASSSTRTAALLALYKHDFPLFARQALKIQIKEQGLVPFKLLPFQSRLHDAAKAQEARRGFIRQIWLKSRQIGSSTLAQGIVFHRTIMNSHFNSIVVAHDIGIAELLFQMSRRFYANLPLELRPTVRHATKQGLVFNTPTEKVSVLSPGLDSKIIVATAKNIHAGAGGTFHAVHLSEAARYPNPEEIETSTLQATGLVKGTVVIIESTARPEGRWFFEMCEMAKKGASPFEFHFEPWTADHTCQIPLDPGEQIGPETPYEHQIVRDHLVQPAQLKWRRLKLAEMRDDEPLFMREFPISEEEAWMRQDVAIFPLAHRRILREGVAPPRYLGTVSAGPIVQKSGDGPLLVWEEPEAASLYDIGADVALGRDGGDWSVAEVIERKTGRQVAEYRAQLAPSEFADILYWLGLWYNQAYLAVERNSIGDYTNERLVKVLGYPNIFLWRPPGKLITTITNTTGWYTTRRFKEMLMATAKDAVYTYCTSGVATFPLIRGTQLMVELDNFVYLETGGTGIGEHVKHDDRVMAWMIAHKARHDSIGEGDFAPVTFATGSKLRYTHTQYMTEEEARVGNPNRLSWMGTDLEGWR